jgi:hypothetical protein
MPGPITFWPSRACPREGDAKAGDNQPTLHADIESYFATRRQFCNL